MATKAEQIAAYSDRRSLLGKFSLAFLALTVLGLSGVSVTSDMFAKAVDETVFETISVPDQRWMYAAAGFSTLAGLTFIATGIGWNDAGNQLTKLKK